MTAPVDVVVVGAGPVGLVAALALSRAGVSVRVLEAQPSIIDQPRAVVYHSPAIEALADLGLSADLHAVGVTKHQVQFRDRDEGVLGAVDFAVLADVTRFPYNLHLGQHDLAAVAYQHLRRHAGDVVRFRTAVNALTQHDDGVVLDLTGPDGPERVHARWVIGADGARSTVRQALALPFEGFTWPERFVATNVCYDFAARGYARSTNVLDPVDWAIIVQIDNRGLWRVTYGEEPGVPVDRIAEGVGRHYARILPDDGEYEVDAVAGYRLHERVVPSFRAGRVLLAGDAAHVNNPIGGYGLTSGLLDAAALGPVLAAVLRGDDDRLLDAWAGERRRVAIEVTQAGAIANKRRTDARDPAERDRIRAEVRRTAADPRLARVSLLYSFRLAGAGGGPGTVPVGRLADGRFSGVTEMTNVQWSAAFR